MQTVHFVLNDCFIFNYLLDPPYLKKKNISNHSFNAMISPASMQYQTIATTDNMDHRAALANITNMEVDNSKYGEFIKDQLLNNKENLIEQVSRQKIYLDSFVEEKEEEREEEQELMETELPSYVSSLPSASEDQVFPLASLTIEMFAHICSFLPPYSVCQLELSSSVVKETIEMANIWRGQVEKVAKETKSVFACASLAIAKERGWVDVGLFKQVLRTTVKTISMKEEARNFLNILNYEIINPNWRVVPWKTWEVEIPTEENDQETNKIMEEAFEEENKEFERKSLSLWRSVSVRGEPPLKFVLRSKLSLIALDCFINPDANAAKLYSKNGFL